MVGKLVDGVCTDPAGWFVRRRRGSLVLVVSMLILRLHAASAGHDHDGTTHPYLQYTGDSAKGCAWVHGTAQALPIPFHRTTIPDKDAFKCCAQVHDDNAFVANWNWPTGGCDSISLNSEPWDRFEHDDFDMMIKYSVVGGLPNHQCNSAVGQRYSENSKLRFQVESIDDCCEVLWSSDDIHAVQVQFLSNLVVCNAYTTTQTASAPFSNPDYTILTKGTPPNCSPGQYVVNYQAWSCSNCPSGSTTFGTGRHTSCTTCNDGTFAEPGSCTPCDATCATCDNANTCLSCAQDYTDHGSGVCLRSIPVVTDTWPRVVAAQQAQNGDGSASFSLQFMLDGDSVAGGDVYAVAIPSSATAPQPAQVIAATDGDDIAAAAAGMVAAAATETAITIELAGDLLAAGDTSHTVYVVFADLSSPPPMFTWTLGGDLAGAACAISAHCASGLACVHPASICAPSAPKSSVVDAYFVSPPDGASDCDEPTVAAADIVLTADDGGVSAATAPTVLVKVSTSPADTREFKARPAHDSSGDPRLVISGSGEGTYEVSLSLLEPSSGVVRAMGSAEFTVSCAHLAASSSGCAGSDTCVDADASVEAQVQLLGYDASGMTSAARDALAAVMEGELGLADGAVEVTSAIAAEDGISTEMRVAVHLPDSLAGESAVTFRSVFNAAPASDLPLSTLRPTLFNAVARLVRRAVATTIGPGACCTATMTAPRLARPTSSVATSASTGIACFTERTVQMDITVANAPSGSGDVTTLWVAWTWNAADPDPTPEVDQVSGSEKASYELAAGANSVTVSLPTAPSSGGTLRYAALASAAGYRESTVFRSEYTFSDQSGAAPVVS